MLALGTIWKRQSSINAGARPTFFQCNLMNQLFGINCCPGKSRLLIVVPSRNSQGRSKPVSARSAILALRLLALHNRPVETTRRKLSATRSQSVCNCWIAEFFRWKLGFWMIQRPSPSQTQRQSKTLLKLSPEYWLLTLASCALNRHSESVLVNEVIIAELEFNDRLYHPSRNSTGSLIHSILFMKMGVII